MSIFPEKIFAVWKPRGMSSFAVVAAVRRITGEKKVGHAGTLDPLAEGVLVVATGAATKKISEEVAKEKEYEAVVRLGATSTTDDEEGEKSVRFPVSGVKQPEEEDVRDVIKDFVGTISQIPPAYSAVKIKGKPAYKYARRGQMVELKSREVLVKNIEISSYEWPLLKLRITTGPGVYIRSLARDIGEQLGVGGYMAALTRTRVGDFTRANTIEFDDVKKFFGDPSFPIR